MIGERRNCSQFSPKRGEVWQDLALLTFKAQCVGRKKPALESRAGMIA